jgi:rfaE bifunctional protein nucleotidyltransferase chain/domain
MYIVTRVKKAVKTKAPREPVEPFGTKGRFVDDKEKLAELVAALRTIGAKIVLTQGSFDFIHIGHFLYLEKARSHGDILIVGVDDDEKVSARKGPERPIVSEEERVKMLTHVRHVDIVTLKHKDDAKWALIKLVRPDVLISTNETYTKEQIKQLTKYCKEVIVLEPQATTSTSAKLRRLNIGLSQKMRDAITESINQTFEKLMKHA